MYKHHCTAVIHIYVCYAAISQTQSPYKLLLLTGFCPNGLLFLRNSRLGLGPKSKLLQIIGTILPQATYLPVTQPTTLQAYIHRTDVYTILMKRFNVSSSIHQHFHVHVLRAQLVMPALCTLCHCQLIMFSIISISLNDAATQCRPQSEITFMYSSNQTSDSLKLTQISSDTKHYDSLTCFKLQLTIQYIRTTFK